MKNPIPFRLFAALPAVTLLTFGSLSVAQVAPPPPPPPPSGASSAPPAPPSSSTRPANPPSARPSNPPAARPSNPPAVRPPAPPAVRPPLTRPPVVRPPVTRPPVSRPHVAPPPSHRKSPPPPPVYRSHTPPPPRYAPPPPRSRSVYVTPRVYREPIAVVPRPKRHHRAWRSSWSIHLPGFGITIGDIPRGAVYFSVGRDHYYYCDGLYFAPHRGNYIRVAAPYGLVVHELPSRYRTFYHHGTRYYESYGTYYYWEPAYEAYVVCQAPY